jgi:hypothetical protein
MAWCTAGKEMGSRKKKGDKFKELREKEKGGNGGKGATFAALKAAEQAAAQSKSTDGAAQEVELEIVSDSQDQK